MDGLDVYVAGNADLNFVFDRYISTKSELRETTYTNYTYMYDRFVRDVFNHWSPFFTLLLGTGCRIGEVVGQRWQDVDMESRVIDVNHSMTYYPRRTDTYKCEFKVSLPKPMQVIERYQ